MPLTPNPHQPATTQEVDMSDATNYVFNPHAKPLSLWDAIASDDSRTNRTVLFFDVVGSTAAKETQPEATWVTTTAWFYSKVTEIVQAVCPDAVFKFLGDGVMVVVDSDEATQAIIAAVRVQEAISDGRGGNDGGRVVDFSVCIGIASGEVRAFSTPAGTADFLGSTCDRASRLCAAANPNAVLIDRASGSAANWFKVRSRVGEVFHRTADQYQGDLQRVALKGFASPVEYFEVSYFHQLFGLKSSPVTATTDRLSVAEATRQRTDTRPPTVTVTADLQSRRGARDERTRGNFKNWLQAKDCGFLTSPSGEDFHAARKNFVYPDDADKVKPGTEVVFTVVAGSGRCRTAGAVLIVGEYADGVLIALPAGKPYGWLRVYDVFGNRGLVYLPLSTGGPAYKIGETLSFKVAATDQGAKAADVTREAEEAA